MSINSFEALGEEASKFAEGALGAHPPAAARSTARASAKRPSPSVLLRACRPRQWSKNLLVLAAPCAAGLIDRPRVLAEVGGAFVAFCLLSSATYLLNDVRDREQDRLHPDKRRRPVAAGELSVRAALGWAAALALLGLALGSAIAPELGAVGALYLAVTATYSLWWRRVAVLDVLAIAAGFVLRALAGGAATDIYLSRWFVIVTACGAVFLVAGKRYAELGDGVAGSPARATLRRYSPGQLRLVLLAAATAAGVAYTAWAFTRPAHVVLYTLSIAPLALWLARYATLLGKGDGQAPEQLILRDRLLVALGAAWALLFLSGVYAGH